MSVPVEVSAKLSRMKPYADHVASFVREKVLGLCESKGYAFVGRAKEDVSVYEKIESGRFRCWSDLDDLYGCAIVIPTLHDEPEVLRLLGGMFLDSGTKRRGSSQKSPDSFRFDATRFVGRLRNGFDAESPIARIKFEVQIRTAFEHAWSVTTHSLAYKGDRIDWRRLRLASQMKASVEQLDLLVMGFEASSSLIDAHAWPDIQVRAAVEEVIRDGLTRGVIPSENGPGSWTRLCDNVFGLVKNLARARGVSLPKMAETVVSALRSEIGSMNQSGYPRSLPMMQFVLGVVAKNGLLSAGTEGYVPFVTEALRTLYPQVSVLNVSFDMENAVT